MPGIIFYGSMIYLYGQDIMNLTSAFSEDNYRNETLKIDYDIGVDYYDIKNADKNVKISSSKKSLGQHQSQWILMKDAALDKDPQSIIFKVFIAVG